MAVLVQPLELADHEVAPFPEARVDRVAEEDRPTV
jgi:hypothetical protein